MPCPKLFQRLPFRLAGSILLLSGATLIILTEVGRRAVERLLLEQAEIQAALSAAAVADGLDAVIGSAGRIAHLVARECADRTLTAADAAKRARDVLLDSPNVHGCIIALEPGGAAPEGSAVAIQMVRDNTVSRFTTRDLQAEQPGWPLPWYREILDKAQAVWSEPFVDHAGSGLQAVRIAVPVLRDHGGDRVPVGAVALVIDLQWLRRLANVQEFSDTSFTIVFSRTGRIILHPRPNYAIAETIKTIAEKTGAAELLTIQQNVRARRQGALRYAESFPSRRVHVNYKPARHAGWGIIVGYDEAEFLTTQHTYRLISFGTLAGLLILLTGIIVVVTRRALRPLGQLERAADEIARRNLDCAIPIPRREDEVGRLARSFLAMRDALKAQLLEGRWAAQSIEHQLRYHQLIIDSMHEPVFVVTKTLRISRVNPAALRLSGYDGAAMLQKPFLQFVTLAGSTGETAELLMQALRDGRELHGITVVLRQRDDGERAMQLNLVPIRDSGRIVGGVVTLHGDAPAASPT